MRRLMLVSAMVLGTFAAGVEFTAAADLPAGMPVKAPSQVVAVSWTGLYAGVSVGAARDRANGTSDFLDPSSAAPGKANPQSNSFTKTSFAGGAYVGYNWQVFPNIVVGFENDWTWMKSSYSFCRQTDTTSAACSDTGDGFLTIGSKLDWMATSRGRIGVTFNDVLIYGTGGLAVGEFRTSLNMQCLQNGCGANSTTKLNQTATFTDYRLGWVAGGGIEYLLAARWLLRAEYLHADFGNVTNTLATNGNPGTQTAVWSRKETVDLVRAGVAFKFN